MSTLLLPHIRDSRQHSVSFASRQVLEHILSHEECDVDPINRLDKATPLHLAVKLEDPDERLDIIESLLDAGADTTYVNPPSPCRPHTSCFRIKDKYGRTVLDLIPQSETEIHELIRKSRADATVSRDDIAGTHITTTASPPHQLTPPTDDDIDYDGPDSGSDED